VKGLVMSSGRKYPQELKERAIRLVGEAREHDAGLSQHAAVTRIAKLVGVHPDTLRVWVRQTDINAGRKPGVTTDGAVRIRELEREVRVLKRANEIEFAALIWYQFWVFCRSGLVPL
jgi:transposase